MKSENLMEFAAKHGFKVENGTAYGFVGGFFTSLRLDKGLTMTFAIEPRLYSDNDKALHKEFTKKISGICMIQEKSVQITAVISRTEQIDQVFNDITSKVLNLFQKYGFMPRTKCPFCGKEENCNAIAAIGGVSLTHKECIDKLKEEGQEDSREVKTSLASGLFGAFLLSVLVSMGIAFFVHLTNSLFSLFYYLIPIAAIFGFRKFHGRNCLAAGISIVFISLLQIVIIEYFLLVAAFLKFMPLNYAAEQAIYLLMDGDFWITSMEDAGFGILFTFLALLTSSAKIKAISTSTAKSRERISGEAVAISADELASLGGTRELYEGALKGELPKQGPEIKQILYVLKEVLTPILFLILFLVGFLIVLQFPNILPGFFPADKMGYVNAQLMVTYWANQGLFLYAVWGGAIYLILHIVMIVRKMRSERAVFMAETKPTLFFLCLITMVIGLGLMGMFVNMERPQQVAAQYHSDYMDYKEGAVKGYRGYVAFTGNDSYSDGPYIGNAPRVFWEFKLADGNYVWCIKNAWKGLKIDPAQEYIIEYLPESRIIITFSTPDGVSYIEN